VQDTPGPPHPMRSPAGDGVDVPVLLARWRRRELRLARSFKECSRATTTELEELLDSTTLVLLDKHYDTPEHLRAALHRGIKMRALRLHRDRVTRHNTLEAAAHAQHAEENARAWEQDPHHLLITQEDDLIIGEFLAELTPSERNVFVLVAEGRSWRAIATHLALPENQARNTVRACERKRERFLTLYETGRLCGYRSQTITTLLTGNPSSELALDQALAHLRHCHTCQTHHHTTEAQFRAAFDRRALALLPLPLLPPTDPGVFDRVYGFLTRNARALRTPHAGIRDRLIETASGVGAVGKITAGVLSATVLAAGAASTKHPAHHHPPHHTATAARPTHNVAGTALVRHISEAPRLAPSSQHTPQATLRQRLQKTSRSTQSGAAERELADLNRATPQPPAPPPRQPRSTGASRAERELGFER
jgi:DNA-directed RNA polymerase specialized sigma24 family protein